MNVRRAAYRAPVPIFCEGALDMADLSGRQGCALIEANNEPERKDLVEWLLKENAGVCAGEKLLLLPDDLRIHKGACNQNKNS